MKKITTFDVTISSEVKPKQRVAAYIRVPTSNDDQLISLEAQRRPELFRLIFDCEKGKIDFILTKSISRFARNTIDCLKLVRKLMDLVVHIYFEKENINTMDAKGEIMLTIMASLAQQESKSLSQNVKLGIQYRYQQGEV